VRWYEAGVDQVALIINSKIGIFLVFSRQIS